MIVGEAARTPPPSWPAPAATAPPTVAPSPAPAARAEPPQERATGRAQPDIMGYKILPPSYWAGASWRWRTPQDMIPHNPQ
jgi:hypothetical protein